MQLYNTRLSGHSHRARLFLSLIGADYENVEVDLPGGEHKRPAFLALNPMGQVPVLVDGAVVIPDSNAILVYLAKKFGRTDWLPEDPGGAARVQRWLSAAAGPIFAGPCTARLVTVFGAKLNAAEAIERSYAILALVDAQLAAGNWLAAAAPTIADVSLYSYIAAAPEGNVDLSGYPHVLEWLRRVEALPGFAPFARTAAGLAA